MRNKLHNRRPNENRTLTYNGVQVDVSFGYDDELKVKEVFVTTRKLGTAVDIMARDVTVLLSFLLQYGCPMPEVVDVLSSDDQGRPEGLAGQIAQIIIEEEKNVRENP